MTVIVRVSSWTGESFFDGRAVQSLEQLLIGSVAVAVASNQHLGAIDQISQQIIPIALATPR